MGKSTFFDLTGSAILQKYMWMHVSGRLHMRACVCMAGSHPCLKWPYRIIPFCPALSKLAATAAVRWYSTAVRCTSRFCPETKVFSGNTPPCGSGKILENFDCHIIHWRIVKVVSHDKDISEICSRLSLNEVELPSIPCNNRTSIYFPAGSAVSVSALPLSLCTIPCRFPSGYRCFHPKVWGIFVLLAGGIALRVRFRGLGWGKKFRSWSLRKACCGRGLLCRCSAFVVIIVVVVALALERVGAQRDFSRFFGVTFGVQKVLTEPAWHSMPRLVQRLALMFD